MLILGILGSTSENSTTRIMLNEIGNRIEKNGLVFQKVDLKSEYNEMHKIEDFNLPPLNSQTETIRKRIAAADGIVLATPVYHGSYSSVLKNFLDHLRSNAFKQKPVGIIANGGGDRSAATASEHLRTVVRALSGWIVPAQVITTDTDFNEGLLQKEVAGRMDLLAKQLSDFSKLQSK